MDNSFPFTFANLKRHFQAALDAGYRVLRCRDYLEEKRNPGSGPVLVNRVDIDISPRKARRLAAIFNELDIPATFFVRLHAPEYNPFGLEEYRCLKFIAQSAHEIGYHSEIVDQAAIWREDAAACLRRDLSVLRDMFGTEVVGAASHGGLTGLNNLDFWNDQRPEDHGLLYEAYDREPAFDLFHNSFYISEIGRAHV